MKANNSLLRPGIISATDALLLSWSPVTAWKQDWKCTANWGGWQRNTQNMSCCWSWAHFANYSVWFRSSPELLSRSTMEIWFGLPPLPWEIVLALSRLLFIYLEYRTYCMCCVCWCFPGGKWNISRAWFQSGERSCQAASRWFSAVPLCSYRLSARTRCRSEWGCAGVPVPSPCILMWELKGPRRDLKVTVKSSLCEENRQHSHTYLNPAVCISGWI